MNKRAILYLEKDDPCDDIKDALTKCNVEFDEWRVEKNMVDFTLPLLITGMGNYTGKEILRLGPELCNLLLIHPNE